MMKGHLHLIYLLLQTMRVVYGINFSLDLERNASGMWNYKASDYQGMIGGVAGSVPDGKFENYIPSNLNYSTRMITKLVVTAPNSSDVDNCDREKLGAWLRSTIQLSENKNESTLSSTETAPECVKANLSAVGFQVSWTGQRVNTSTNKSVMMSPITVKYLVGGSGVVRGVNSSASFNYTRNLSNWKVMNVNSNDSKIVLNASVKTEEFMMMMFDLTRIETNQPPPNVVPKNYTSYPETWKRKGLMIIQRATVKVVEPKPRNHVILINIRTEVWSLNLTQRKTTTKPTPRRFSTPLQSINSFLTERYLRDVATKNPPLTLVSTRPAEVKNQSKPNEREMVIHKSYIVEINVRSPERNTVSGQQKSAYRQSGNPALICGAVLFLVIMNNVN